MAGSRSSVADLVVPVVSYVSGALIGAVNSAVCPTGIASGPRSYGCPIPGGVCCDYSGYC